MLREHRDNIRMGVEDDRGEGRIRAFPGHDHDRFARNALVGEIGEIKGFCIINQELHSPIVVGFRLHSFYSDIFSEQGSGWIFISHIYLEII